jgi:hypothetical protein
MSAEGTRASSDTCSRSPVRADTKSPLGPAPARFETPRRLGSPCQHQGDDAGGQRGEADQRRRPIPGAERAAGGHSPDARVSIQLPKIAESKRAVVPDLLGPVVTSYA